jgi:hypothetical protein
VITHRAKELVNLVTRVDEDRLSRALAGDEETVLVERRHGTDLQNHPVTYPL